MSHQPDNIFAGTQVVSLVEVRGTNNSLVHPRGAVGAVTRTPAVEGEKFLVRFADGFESSLAKDQLEVLKHFKDRLGRSAGVPPASSGSVSAPSSATGVAAGQETRAPFDLERFIIYRCVVGSRAYGLDNDDSDTDRRGIYLAPADLQWSLFGAPEQFEDNATQSCYWELQKFLTMALKANPNILECLWSPMVEKLTPLGAELLAARSAFLSQMIFQTFNGYALSQFKKIEQDIRNHGEVRWKHAMHLLRLPLWLNEGLAVTFQRAVATMPQTVLDHELKERHLDFWTPDNIQGFWAGTSFQEPGDSNELSYSLAEIMVALLSDQQGNWGAFLQQARDSDAGQTAAIDCFGIGLESVLSKFLGQGGWRPRRKAMVDLWE